MFGIDFYPTPEEVITQMLNGFEITGKVILEPSAGSGNIVDYLKANGAKDVIACEIDMNLTKILQSKCNVIESDFLKLDSVKISHIDLVIMNPPFSKGAAHILHAWNIAPAGCTVLALCNMETLNRTYSNSYVELQKIVESYGSFEELGECFSNAQRKTEVKVALIRITKPASEYAKEFEGFFMGEEEPETQTAPGLMPYNFVRDLVNRYIGAVKLFDKQIDLGIEMNSLTASFYSSSIAFTCTQENKPKTRADFKKDLQKSGWKFIFQKMNLQKYTTRGLRENINKFVENQTQIPFTMRNIYKMIEIVIGTTEARMDTALMEVFNKLTEHYHENRFNVEGWKTNSHYLVNRRFIFPYGAEKNWEGNFVEFSHYKHNGETLIDVEKALCYLTGQNYGEIKGFFHLTRKMIPGEWYDTHFFRIRAYKKGTVHCEFKSETIWGQFNQRIAKLKGFPLYEHKETKHTRKQDEETAKRYRPSSSAKTTQHAVLFEVSV